MENLIKGSAGGVRASYIRVSYREFGLACTDPDIGNQFTFVRDSVYNMCTVLSEQDLSVSLQVPYFSLSALGHVIATALFPPMLYSMP